MEGCKLLYGRVQIIVRKGAIHVLFIVDSKGKFIPLKRRECKRAERDARDAPRSADRSLPIGGSSARVARYSCSSFFWGGSSPPKNRNMKIIYNWVGSRIIDGSHYGSALAELADLALS